eukprot:TRINITY_DN7593_c0_g2_i1.p2 TRINITY_DN7593_c0_g2~~TRINITY_DN7593_c0_g2_i1.p2  ORF type:complete len:214 (+),score=44.11 TRINITY_DN7593_c0_g2_i1:149-790(+)
MGKGRGVTGGQIAQPAYGTVVVNGGAAAPVTRFTVKRTGWNCCDLDYEMTGSDQPTFTAYHKFQELPCRYISENVVSVKQGPQVVGQVHRTYHQPCLLCQHDASAFLTIGPTRLADITPTTRQDLCCGPMCGRDVFAIKDNQSQTSSFQTRSRCQCITSAVATGALEGVHVNATAGCCTAAYNVEASRVLSHQERMELFAVIMMSDFYVVTVH